MGVSPLEIRDSIREGSRLALSASVPEELTVLISNSWDQNPRTRPTFAEIVMFLKNFLATNPLVNNAPVSRIMLSMKVAPLLNNPSDIVSNTSPNFSQRILKQSERNWTRSSLKKKLLIVGTVFLFLVVMVGGIFCDYYCNHKQITNPWCRR
jgi:hypothetical protein